MNIEFDNSIKAINFKNLNGMIIYQIELNRITSSGELLDWIFQLKSKKWADSGIIIRFIHLLDELSFRFHGQSIQATFCPRGENIKNITW